MGGISSLILLFSKRHQFYNLKSFLLFTLSGVIDDGENTYNLEPHLEHTVRVAVCVGIGIGPLAYIM